MADTTVLRSDGSSAVDVKASDLGDSTYAEAVYVGGSNDEVFELTLSLDTNAYADGDLLAAAQEIANVARVAGGKVILNSLVLLDKDDQGQALDLIFLTESETMGTENSALNISDAIADEIGAVVEIAADDYVDLINSQIVTKGPGDLGIMMELTGTSMWVAAVSRGTGTYTAAGITLKIGVMRS